MVDCRNVIRGHPRRSKCWYEGLLWASARRIRASCTPLTSTASPSARLEATATWPTTSQRTLHRVRSFNRCGQRPTRRTACKQIPRATRPTPPHPAHPTYAEGIKHQSPGVAQRTQGHPALAYRERSLAHRLTANTTIPQNAARKSAAQPVAVLCFGRERRSELRRDSLVEETTQLAERLPVQDGQLVRNGRTFGQRRASRVSRRQLDYTDSDGLASQASEDDVTWCR